MECWRLNFSSQSSCLDACVVGTIVVNQLLDVIKLLFKYSSSGVPRIRSALDAGSFCINIMKYHGYGIQVQTQNSWVFCVYHTHGLKLILHNIYNVFLHKIFCGGDFFYLCHMSELMKFWFLNFYFVVCMGLCLCACVCLGMCVVKGHISGVCLFLRTWSQTTRAFTHWAILLVKVLVFGLEVTLVSVCQLDPGRVTWEKGTLTEELLLSGWSVGVSVGHFPD